MVQFPPGGEWFYARLRQPWMARKSCASLRCRRIQCWGGRDSQRRGLLHVWHGARVGSVRRLGGVGGRCFVYGGNGRLIRARSGRSRTSSPNRGTSTLPGPPCRKPKPIELITNQTPRCWWLTSSGHLPPHWSEPQCLIPAGRRSPAYVPLWAPQLDGLRHFQEQQDFWGLSEVPLAPSVVDAVAGVRLHCSLATRTAATGPQGLSGVCQLGLQSRSPKWSGARWPWIRRTSTSRYSPRRAGWNRHWCWLN